MKIRFYISFLILFFQCLNVFATHNRAGEITYEQIGPLTIRATITTYTKASSSSVDRDTLRLFWGDDTSEAIMRTNGEGTLLPGFDIKVNYYTAEHTYPGRGNYTMYFIDPNRVSNILNLNYPNSVDIRFYIETSFALLDDQFQGLNSSAILLQPPIDFACVNQRFIHNPNAYDPDGDSLAYELVTPLENVGEPVPNYVLPNAVSPGLDNTISFDNQTGNFVWDSPQSPGEYNIAILIKEYRNGELINSIIRDMQILVDICDDIPPEIEVQEAYCVVAGETLKIPIKVTDPDIGQQIILTATGGVFQQDSINIDWEDVLQYQDTEYIDTLVWNTECHHVREHPYQLVFRATDNGLSPTEGLSDLKTVSIKVVAPEPKNVEIESNSNGFDIFWESPYFCENAKNNYFKGFSVWRRENSNPFEIDSCEIGLENKGYQIIEFSTQTLLNGKYYFRDANIEAGKVYCYRILANFALTTPGGFSYNLVESLPSNEVCATKSRNIPLLTAVDVKSTGMNDGSIFVSWLKPIAVDVDTIENPGPYTYVLEYANDISGYTEIPGASFSSTLLSDPVDTSFTWTNINTVANSYFFRVAFYSDQNLLGYSPFSESPFLTIVGSDAKNILSWPTETAWRNYAYEVFRFEDVSNDFELLNIAESEFYEDNNLINGEEYCYKIKTIGTYGLPNTPEIITNFSQEVCSTPIDTVPPCPPMLDLTNDCIKNGGISIKEELINFLSWNNPSFVCEESSDIGGYKIYYSSDSLENFELIFEINDPDDLNFEHLPTIGSEACYYVTSLDMIGNESTPSEVICISNCPLYVLPNTFTPNQDGANDVFVPRENKFIELIDFKLFNQWGNKIFETTDPNIDWDGTDLNGNEVDEGAYFYNCTIFKDNNASEEEATQISGFIEVIR